MSDWQERIDRDTEPAIRAEHELRYGILAPLLAGRAVWADLGCGTGLAALAALRGRLPERALLVDIDPAVVSAAARELGIPDTSELLADLVEPRDLQRIGEALLERPGERVVSCFEVVEHLSTFVPLLEWAGALAREGAATFVLSVPNDAFWSIENPYHRSCWGEGAFEELRRLLPPAHTLLRQVALAGSALLDWRSTPERHELAVRVGGELAVATHFVAAFGPRHAELRRRAVAVQADPLARRCWERTRDANLALAERVAGEQRQAIASQEQTIAEQARKLRENTAEFEAWRAYIHQLERELGRPLSGVFPQEPAQ
jgi:SAM-dependent methyltransferase